MFQLVPSSSSHTPNIPIHFTAIPQHISSPIHCTEYRGLLKILHIHIWWDALPYHYQHTDWIIHLYFLVYKLAWTHEHSQFSPQTELVVDEWKTNLMSLAILFHLLCAQHVSDINISIFRSLRPCWWITTSVVLFSVRCVLELLLQLVFGGVRFAGLQAEACKTNTTKYQPQQKIQHNELRTRRPMW